MHNILRTGPQNEFLVWIFRLLVPHCSSTHTLTCLVPPSWFLHHIPPSDISQFPTSFPGHSLIFHSWLITPADEEPSAGLCASVEGLLGSRRRQDTGHFPEQSQWLPQEFRETSAPAGPACGQFCGAGGTWVLESLSPGLFLSK